MATPIIMSHGTPSIPEESVKGQAVQRFLRELARINLLLIQSGTQFQSRSRDDIRSLLSNTESQQSLMFWQARVVLLLSLAAGGTTIYGITIPAGAAHDARRTVCQAAASFLDKAPQVTSPIFSAYQLTHQTSRELIERVALPTSQEMMQHLNSMVQQFQQLELRILEAQRGR